MALEKLLSESEPGTFLPSEPALADQLGVSRATLREAMRTFEDRGWIVRRRGIGTYINPPPNAIDYGLEVLESVHALAHRLGLEVEMRGLNRRRYFPDAHQAAIFGLDQGELLLEVSRVITIDGHPTAYLIDILPDHFLPDDLFNKRFHGSILDLLLDQQNLGFSKTEITAISAPNDVALKMEIHPSTALLCLEAILYTKDWHPIDQSLSYFLPGSFRFHVLRKVGLPVENIRNEHVGEVT
jgi:GntR family transcriptional regulator